MNENVQALATLRTNRSYPRLESDPSLLQIKSSVLPTFGRAFWRFGTVLWLMLRPEHWQQGPCCSSYLQCFAILWGWFTLFFSSRLSCYYSCLCGVLRLFKSYIYFLYVYIVYLFSCYLCLLLIFLVIFVLIGICFYINCDFQFCGERSCHFCQICFLYSSGGTLLWCCFMYCKLFA